MTDHIDTTAEREWLEGLRNRPLSASDRASLMVTFSVTLDALDAERARAEKTEAELNKAADVIATILYRIGGYTERSSGAALDAVDRLIKERDQALARLAAAYKAADICALTPADAEAALQRVVDAAWNEALHEAEAAAEEVVTIWEAVMAIRALKRPETSHE